MVEALPVGLAESAAAAVWRAFFEIAAIPRCSGNEAAIRAYLVAVANECGCGQRSDAAGNLVVYVPATAGREQSSTVILQAHLDMVCEQIVDEAGGSATGSATGEGPVIGRRLHRFDRDPIRVIVEGDAVRADATTLGADNGIAVAMMVALMRGAGAGHPPLECLFTVSEEVGLVGARALDPTLLSGRVLINLDSEDEGVICVGCAGGATATGSVPLQRAGEPASPLVDVRISGLHGGHSGMEIAVGYGNAVVVLARALRAIGAVAALRIHDFRGGDKQNVIPRSAGATIEIGGPAACAAAQQAFERCLAAIRAECWPLEPHLSAVFAVRPTPDGAATVAADAPAAGPPLTVQSTRDLLQVVTALHHGVISMSPRVPGLVQSSSNVAAVELRGNTLHILTSHRSDLDSARDYAVDRFSAVVAAHGGSVEVTNRYPGWPADPQSALVRFVADQYAGLHHKTARIEAVHAGLECGVIGEKIPAIQMVSVGPTIHGAHTPAESLSIGSTERVWRLVVRLLDRSGELRNLPVS